MSEKPDPTDQRERNKNMDRYDSIMNPIHYSEKGWKKVIANLDGKCLDGTPSKAQAMRYEHSRNGPLRGKEI